MERPPMPESVRQYMRLHGKYLGLTHGSTGGQNSAKKLTPKQLTARAKKAGLASGSNMTADERRERAKAAAAARWAKKEP